MNPELAKLHAQPPAQIVHSEEVVRLLGEQMGMGFWRLVIKTGAVFWSDRVFEIYGLVPQEEPLTFDQAIAVIVPEDRKRVAALMAETLKQRRGRKYMFRADGPTGIKVIECTADTVLSAGGQVREVFGTMLDITARATPDATAVGRSLLLRALMKNIPAAIAIFDNHMHYLAVSDFWVSGHYAKSARDLVGKSHYQLRPDLTDEHKAEHRRVLDGETVHSPRSYTKDRYGNHIHQTCVMCPWHTTAGTIGGMIMMLGTVDFATAPKGPAATPALPTKRELLDVLRDLV